LSAPLITKCKKYTKQERDDIIKKYNALRYVALNDRYGNGKCENCGWKFEKDADILVTQ